MVKNENFIVIQGFMINELNLKGNELLVYAIIYGFSQAENQKFNGSIRYLVEWTNSSRKTILGTLKSLIDKNLIIKTENYINNVKFCEYQAIYNREEEITPGVSKLHRGGVEITPGGVETTLPGSVETTPNNIYIYNIDNNIDNKKKKKETEYDLIINQYTDNLELRNTIYEFIKMRKAIKKPMTSNALSLILKRLDKLSNNNDNAKVKILENSIINSWQGIFELKNDPPKKKSFIENMRELYEEVKWEDEQAGVSAADDCAW